MRASGLFICGLLALLVLVIPPPMAEATMTILPAFAEIQGPCRNTTTSLTLVITMNSAPVEGNLCLLFSGTQHGSTTRTISSISQTGVTWTSTSVGGGSYVSPYVSLETWKGVVGAGASATLTITYSGIPAQGIADVWEFQGLSGTPNVYANNNNDSASPIPTGTTGVTSSANQLWVACWWVRSSTGANGNMTNGFTAYDGTVTGTYYALVVGLKNATEVTTASSQIDVGGSSLQCFGAVGTFPKTSTATAHSLTLDCRYENGTTMASTTVLVQSASGDTTMTVYGSPKLWYFSESVDSIQWTCGSFTRVIHPTNGGDYTFLVPGTGQTVAVYQFNIKDYSDVLTDPSYLEYWRTVNGVTYLVGDMEIADTLNGVPLVWVYSGIYEVVVRTSSADYSQGYILAGDDYDINVLLKELTFTASAIASYKYVTMEAVRPSSTQIVTSWNNTLTPTYNITSGTVFIYYRNGTQATNSTISAEAGSFTWNSANNVTDYRVYVTASHQYLGAVHYEKVLSGANSAVTDFPSLDVFGGGTTTFNSEALAVASMFIIGGAVSFASIPLGALSLVALGGFYSYSGVIPLTSDVMWTLIGLVGLIFLASRRGG